MASTRISYLWNITLALLLALLLARFAVAGQAKVLFNTQSSDGDESAYLASGLALRETGALSDGTRPPLYPAFLALAAERDWRYFTWAKLITLAQGAASVLVVFGVGRRLFNRETGLLAAFLLAANREFHLRASTVYADTLLVLLFVAAWYALIKSFSRPWFRYLAGFLAGLAYLTKGSGTLLLMAWGLTALVVYRRQILRQIPQLMVVPLVFLLTVLPLLVFNAQNFGSPFYNFATTHVMWMDRWAESQVGDESTLPTAASYFQTHSAGAIADRLRVGITKLQPELTATLIPSRTLDSPWSQILAVAALAVAGWLVIFKRDAVSRAVCDHRVTLLASLFGLGLYTVFSVWYARVLMESRFLIPMLGPVYILLAAVVVGAANLALASAAAHPWQRWSLAGALALALAGGAGWLVDGVRADSWSLAVNPFESDRAANVEPEALAQWLQRDHPAERGPARLVFGPSKSLPLWKFPANFTFERIPAEVDSWAKMEAYLRAAPPDYLIIDSDTARRRREALGAYFGYTDDGIELKQLPAGWPLAYLHGSSPLTWAIFTPFRQPQNPLAATFGHQLDLLGYDVTAAENPRRLRVALYWQAAAPLPADYVTFLHLTAPDGFVKAQQDRSPFDGRWPTSRWQAGAVLADRFDLPLDGVPPGDYLLLAGMYAPDTGARLPLTAGPPAPQPDAALLGHVTF